ncbi:MAG: hypothetical protein DBX05_07050 [Candidatus Poseidoniales archaeon]|nr:MAG: hypothetical protein DBX05_07050 [Candidatus Poseidoniales archaeon]
MDQYDYEEYRALELGDVVHVNDEYGNGKGHWYVVTGNNPLSGRIEGLQINRQRNSQHDSFPLEVDDTMNRYGDRPILNQNSFVKIEIYEFPYNQIGNYCGYVLNDAMRNIIDESKKKLGR